VPQTDLALKITLMPFGLGEAFWRLLRPDDSCDFMYFKLIIVRVLTLLTTMALLTAYAIAGDGTVDSDTKLMPAKRNLWKWSLVAYGTANVLDTVSSIGPHYGHETNSHLTNSNGNFQTSKAIAVKSSVFAATGVAEYLIIRKWPQFTKLFSIINFGWSGAETGVAAHNFTLKK
jgi:hypothetical protein